jgi:2-oxoisovalerate dehydrogenase E2 component (dihydrolipoyl transacylase)
MPEFKLPDVGEGLTEAEIVSWKVKVGDTVAINEIIVEIETAKSIVELPSPYAGEVARLLVSEGDTVAVGTPIIAIGADAAAEGAAEAAPGAGPATDAPIDTNVPPEGNATLVGYGPRETKLERRPRRAASGGQAARVQTQAAFDPGPSPLIEADNGGRGEAVEAGAPATSLETTTDLRPLAKPPVRKLAKDLGVDLRALTGSGEGGVVTRADVEAAAAGPDTPLADTGVASTGPAAASWTAGERETREPIKGVRKMMAQAMSRSAFTSPHVTEWITVDVTATMELVERLKRRRELAEVRVGPLLVLARACMLAIRRTPQINSYWDDDAQEVVLKHYVNLGIAAATPRGLVVPNVKDADGLSMADLARALADLTATARDGRTQPADMSGGTFTITNVGVFGVDAGTPIINPGESAILAFGAIRKQPWVVEGPEGDEIVPRHLTTLALSFDHRHVDGEAGSRFLADVAGILEDPATALLF